MLHFLAEINYLKIASLNIIFIPLAIFLYRIIHKLNLNVAKLIAPALAFVLQTILMYVLANVEMTRFLSVAISEVAFWLLLFATEFIILIKNIARLKKQL